MIWWPFGYGKYKLEMNLERLSKSCLGIQNWLYGRSLGRKIIGSILDILSSRWLWGEVLIGIELSAMMCATGSCCYRQSGRKSVKTCSTLWWSARVDSPSRLLKAEEVPGMQEGLSVPKNWDSTRQSRVISYPVFTVPYHPQRIAIECSSSELRSLN